MTPDWPPKPEPERARLSPDRLDQTAPKVTLTTQAHRVLRAYASGRDITDHEAYRLAGFPPGRTSFQRCHDLRLAGYIARTKRGKSPSKHAAWKSAITELGMRYLLKLEPF